MIGNGTLSSKESSKDHFRVCIPDLVLQEGRNNAGVTASSCKVAGHHRQLSK